MKYAYLIVAIVSLVVMGASAQVNPIPAVDGPVSPQAVIPGGAAFTLTVRGANFVSGAVVNWNGAARTTTFISAGELQAQILASDVAVPGSALVTVTNPLPGGGLSSSSYGLVEVHQPISTIILSKPHTYGVPPIGYKLYTADFNGDSKLDLLQSGFGYEVLLGNGDGSFTRSASFSIHNHGVDPGGFSFGDFNGDSNQDFAYVLEGGSQAFVCLGKGGGKFQTPTSFGTFASPVQTATGDFNRDGKLDLIVAASDGLYLLLGNGDGTFQPQQMIVPISAFTVTSADFNGDGILDLGFYDRGTGFMGVLLGNGDGSFESVIETQPGYYPVPLNDFNGDGKLDFAILGSGNPWPLGVLLGNGDGTFQNAQFFSTGFTGEPPFFTAGDFNSDGNTDLLSYSGSGFLAGFLAGKGDGTFQRVARITLPGPTTKGLAVVGDFNSDGLLDFVINAGGGSEVFLQAPQ
jgi:hypothetical protein